MVSILDLWLPILLAAVFVFVASSVIHMVLPIHKSDFRKLPGEDQIRDSMRGQNVRPGQYMFPCPGSMKDMTSPDMVDKYRQGPNGFLTVVPPGVPSMNKSLVQWFLFSLLIGVFAGYAGEIGLHPGASYGEVFRLTGTVAILGYGVSSLPDSIWKGASWGTTAKFVFDGIVYGLVTAGTFGWLWPAAA